MADAAGVYISSHPLSPICMFGLTAKPFCLLFKQILACMGCGASDSALYMLLQAIHTTSSQLHCTWQSVETMNHPDPALFTCEVLDISLKG